MRPDARISSDILPVAVVRRVRAYLLLGYSPLRIAELFELHPTAVYQIRRTL